MEKFKITKLRLYRPAEDDKPYIEYIVGKTKLGKQFVEKIEQLEFPDLHQTQFKIILEDGSYLTAGGFGFVIHCEKI